MAAAEIVVLTVAVAGKMMMKVGARGSETAEILGKEEKKSKLFTN